MNIKEMTDELTLYLFQIVIYVLITISILSIAGNVVFGFPWHVNIKWGAMILMGVGVKTAVKRGARPLLAGFILFAFLIFIILPVSFIDSGGSDNNAIAYTFLLMIVVTFFFKDKPRWFFFAAILVIFPSLLTLEYLRPDLLAEYDRTTHFYDRIFQIPLTLVAGYLFLRTYANAYNREKERLHRLVHLDFLTGLYNRRSFDMKLEETIQSLNDASVYCVFIDLDDFKLINDERGHLEGDRVLQAFADFLKKTVSENNTIARWGGDEFAIIFHGEKPELDQTLTTIHTFEENLSAGATRLKKTDTLDTVFKRADRAVYQIKAEKKNYATNNTKTLENKT